MLSYLYHCDMLLDVIAGKLEVKRPDFHQFLWERLPLFYDNLLGITEVLAALCVKDEEKSFIGWSVVWRGLCRKPSSLSPWRSDELGMEENTASRHWSQHHFFYFRKKYFLTRHPAHIFQEWQNLVKLKKEQRLALICCEQTGYLIEWIFLQMLTIRFSVICE